jgi:putative hemolysin
MRLSRFFSTLSMRNPRSGPRGGLEMRWIAIAVVLGSVSIWPRIAWTLANPASQFCIKSGGKSEIRTGPNGQYGVSRLPDGRVVDEWNYYRKMKGQHR